MKKIYFKLCFVFIVVLSSLNITAQNTAPTFTSTPITSINDNQTYSYTVTTSDVDNDFVTVTAPTIPAWLSLNTQTNVSTLAGATYGFSNGTGTAAKFARPFDVAVDASGNVYVADYDNNSIRKITSTGVVTTLAGSGVAGFADGTGAAAKFNRPSGVAVDASGNVYVADQYNHRIRKITPAGVVSTFAGSGVPGVADGVGTTAQFDFPVGIAADASGNIYVADYGSNLIRKITPTGVVTTLAGSGDGFADGTGTAAKFSDPFGIAVDASGNVYVADYGNNIIRKITPAGVVTTLAGHYESGLIGGGFANGIGTTAKFNRPSGVAVDASGNVYVADQSNDVIRKITPTGVVTTFAGRNPTDWITYEGFADGIGTNAEFYNPTGIAVDASRNVYVADQSNSRIRKITGETILSGSATGHVGTYPVILNANDGHGGSTNQSFTVTVNNVAAPTVSSLSPVDNATGVAASSNFVITFNKNVQKGTGNILIKDASDGITVQTIDVTTSAVSISNAVVTINPPSDLDKGKSYYIQIPATAFTDNSAVYAFAGILDKTTWNFATVADSPPTFTSTPVTNINDNQTYSYTVTTSDVDNDFVSVTATTLPSWLSLDKINGNVLSVFAGQSSTWGGFTDGTGTDAQFDRPRGLTVDNSGNIYVADSYNNAIRKISSSGVVTTLAGGGNLGSADGTGNYAQFYFPHGVAVDASGNVYVADTYNHEIRKITPSGVVTTLAGSVTSGFVNGTGTAARFNNPTGVAVDASGNIYVADQGNNCIRKITPAGVVTTFAGSSTSGYADGTGTAAQFNSPTAVTIDASGNIYVADNGNNRIRKITPAGVVSTLAGSTQGYADGAGNNAKFYQPTGVTIDASGNIYVADNDNGRIRKITPTGVVSTVAQSSYPAGIAIDTQGNIYVTDGNNQIDKIAGETILTGNASGHVGTYPVVLNANDGHGGSTNQSFTVTVHDVPPPTITTLSPADNATGVIVSSNLVITFNENVQKGTGNILIKDASDGSTVQTIDVTTSAISISNAVVRINPPTDLDRGKSYYIQIPATAFTDLSGNAFAGILDKTTWNFVTESKAVPVLTFANITKTYGDASFDLAATSNSTGTISYSIVGEANGTILSGKNDKTVSLGNIGSVTLRATVAADANYSAYTKDITLTIGAKAITITADTKTKVYGEADPSLTYQITTGSLVGTDTLTGSLSRAPGEDVGSYAINQNTLTAGSNYVITYVPSSLDITAKAITITADAKTKVYGEADPSLTYQITTGALVGTDVLTGNLSRTAGEDVGTYAINQNTLTAGYNYVITYVGAFLNITAAAVQATTQAATSVTTSSAILNGTIYVGGDQTTVVFEYGLTADLSGSNTTTDAVQSPLGADAGTSTVNLELAGLSDNTTYYFRVKGTNSVGTAIGSILSFTTLNASPSVTNLLPADNATDVTSSNLKITFSENVQKGTGNILIKKSSDDAVVATIDVTDSKVSINNATVTLNLSPTLTLPSNTELYVQIPKTAFTDLIGNDFAGILDKTSWSFTTGTVLGIKYVTIKGFSIYPNPTSGLINFTSKELIDYIQVFNIRGKLITQKKIKATRGTINLSFLPKGTYFIRVFTKDKSNMVKLIKQ